MPRAKLWQGLLFALIAGPGTLLWLLIAAPVFGNASAAAFAGLATVIAHPLFIAPHLRRGAIATLLTAALALPIALFRPDPAVVAALVPVLLGIARSAVIYPRSLLRALAIEATFSGLGLLLAAFFYDGSAIGITFAIWVFWLIQAAFALTGGRRAVEESDVDPFERAQANALALLERRAR